jgi:pimeloyl-ACP methyl ester carboxylesterase
MTARHLAAIQKSTIVRSFAFLERFAPAVGARWAETLWFTVPGARGPHDRHAGPGRPFQVRVHGAMVAGELWGDRPVDGAPGQPGAPVVYLMHGWGGWRGQLDPFVGPLVDGGFRVVAFDALGHGASDPGPEGPGRGNILELADTLAAVVAANGPAHAVVAHSLGATAAAFALRQGLPVGRLVFVSPMADPLPYTRAFAARLGFGERIRTRLVARVERRIGMPMPVFDVPAMAQRVATPPLLLLHDRLDAETAWADSEAIARTWPGARLVTTTGLGHRRILRAPAVVAEVIRFVADPAPPVRSGPAAPAGRAEPRPAGAAPTGRAPAPPVGAGSPGGGA